jgi:hypothetical protein
MFRLFSLPLVFLAVTLSFSPAAEEVKDDSPIPATLKDPAFSRYVDLALVRTALTERDPAILCDVALQLAEGERVLLRSHKGLPSSRVFTIALEVATQAGDKATLARLAKTFKAQKNNDLAMLADAALKVGGKARRVDSSLLVSPDSMSVEGLVLYRSFLEQIKLAKTLKDREKLEELEKSIASLPDLGDTQRKALKKMITAAKGALPKADDDGDDLLRKLAASSRGGKSKK